MSLFIFIEAFLAKTFTKEHINNKNKILAALMNPNAGALGLSLEMSVVSSIMLRVLKMT